MMVKENAVREVMNQYSKLEQEQFHVYHSDYANITSMYLGAVWDSETGFMKSYDLCIITDDMTKKQVKQRIDAYIAGRAENN